MIHFTSNPISLCMFLQGFDTGSVRKFFMGTKEALGGLTYLRIWHDNAGTGDNQNWYLNKIVVDDPQTNIR